MVGVQSKLHAAKRQKILDVSAALFAQQGFTKTSIAEISRSCKSSKTWVYHYFPTKDDILFELLHDFLTTVQERLSEKVADDDRGPEQRLRSFVGECLQIYDDYRINYPTLFNEMIFLPENRQKKLRAIERQSVEELSSIIQEIRPDTTTSPFPVRSLTLIVFGTINWTYTWFDPDGKFSTQSLADLVCDFILNGLSNINLEVSV